MNIRVIVPFVDKANRRIYPKEVVRGIMWKINEEGAFVTWKAPEEGFVDLSDAVAYVVDVEYIEESNSLDMRLGGRNKVLEYAMKNAGKEFNELFEVVPSGMGVIDNDGVIREYNLVCFYIVPKRGDV